jgi:hypothetical protein
MKEIEIIPLAKIKMERRRIPEAWIAEALRNADQVVEGHGGRSVAQQRRKSAAARCSFGLFSKRPRINMW